jgi:glycolate oxidase subunit GlcD
MLSAEIIHQLRKIVGASQVSVARTDAELYSYDASLVKARPGVVVFPADTSEAARVVRTLSAAGIPLVPRGFGTNLSGGTISASGGAVICLSRLNRILGIYPQRRCAVVQPGVTNLELQQALAPLGFFYAPDPASQKVATIGGNTGENSGGPRCLKYGVTTNHILGLEVILPAGEVLRIGGPALDPPGYDLRGLIVGSEGTLGIVTEITVRILPQPESIITMLAVYNDISDAARSVSDIIAAGIVPTTLEMMDAPVIQAVEDSYACGYPRDAAAVLIIEVQGPSAGLADQAARILQLCRQNRCREIKEAKDDRQRDRLWEGRRGAFGAVARLAPNYLVNDCTVPRTKLPEALAAVAQIAEKYRFAHGNVFHAGDGNLHPLLLFDSRDAQQLDRVEKAGWEIMQTCVKLGGTISGEHGIGREKLEAMRMIFSEEDLAVQRALKKAFDPRNILNPGKVIPEPGHTDAKEAPAIRKMEPVLFAPAAHETALGAIREKIRNAVSRRKALLPTGRKNRIDFGNFSEPPAEPLETEGLADIIDYDPPNQLVTVGAGMSIAKLQTCLAAHQQWLPLRPPLSLQKHTVGGMVALGACGPERLLYGAPRDMLLGLRFINGRGNLISTGGKVVKNVAGYDLTRLLAGSFGTLGLITETTCRVAMMPERCEAIAAGGPLEACAAAASGIVQSDLLPVFVASSPDGPGASKRIQNNWKMVVGFEGFAETVSYQLEKCAQTLEKGGLKSPQTIGYGVHAGLFGDDYQRLDRSAFILGVDLPLDRVSNFVTAFDGNLAVEHILLDFGCGRILAGLEDLNASQWTQVCNFAYLQAGHLQLQKAPVDFKRHHDVFGPPGPEWKLMYRIKAALDPDGVFAPGRLPGKV